MSKEFYISIGYTVAWCVKYIFIPFVVAVAARIFVEKLLNHSRTDKRKNGLVKTVLRIKPSHKT